MSSVFRAYQRGFQVQYLQKEQRVNIPIQDTINQLKPNLTSLVFQYWRIMEVGSIFNMIFFC